MFIGICYDYGNEYMTEMTLWDDCLGYGSFGFYAGMLLYHLGNKYSK